MVRMIGQAAICMALGVRAGALAGDAAAPRPPAAPEPTLQQVSEGRCAPTSIPDVALLFELDGCPIDIDARSCGDVVPLADGFFLFVGRYEVADLGAVRWALRVDPDPFVIANFVVTNNTLTTQTFSLTVLLPAVLAAPTVVGGSVSGTVSDGNRDGAALAAPALGAVYQGIIDNAPVPGGALLPFPTAVSAPQFETAVIGPASFGAPIPSQPFGAVSINLGISLAFTLTAADSASLTSIIVVNPKPPGPDEADDAAEGDTEVTP